jgi:hypothetical protein
VTIHDSKVCILGGEVYFAFLEESGETSIHVPKQKKKIFLI